MKNFQIYFILAILLSFTACSERTQEKLVLHNMRVEGRMNPVGIDLENPRLSWNIQSPQRNIMQTAYHILVASSPEILANNEGDLWNSGIVSSDRSVQVEYQGKRLKSKMQCYWKVKIWSENGESDWSESSFWSMGLMHYNDWKGRWIGFDRAFPWDDVSMFARLSARYFRKEFDVEKPVQSAKLYIIGLGLYEPWMNGQKIGDQVLAPVPTYYSENVKYNAFDVTDFLREGSNALGVVLGNGRYFTMRQHYKPYKIKNFGFPKMLLQLEIEYTDGSSTLIKTDDSWKGTANGPILTNNEWDGEEYDARKEMPGWNEPGFDDSGWLQAEYAAEPFGTFEAQLTRNMKVMDTLVPVSVNQVAPDRYVLDMGQNMTGWVSMVVEGRSGQKVKLRFAEVLKDNGEIFMANLRDAQVTDIYTLKGEGVEYWEPRFVYHGFRYVEVTGYPGRPSVNDFLGKMVYDEMETTGKFESSSSLLDQIHQNAWWGIAGNYKGMPVDCPQRNERQPWLGDHAIVALGESFLFDNYLHYRKWMDDIQYSQKAGGALPDVAPPYFNYYSDNMTWPGTYLIVADMLYTQYGDKNVLQKHYPSMKKWLEYMTERYMTDDYILPKDSYGDWCAPPPTLEEGRGQTANVKYPSDVIATAYYYHFMGMMTKFANILGIEEDIPGYQDMAQKVRENFNEKFYHADSSYYGDNTLTHNLLSLNFGLVPEEGRDALFNTIQQIILERNDGHLSTGLIGTQWLMRTLTLNGRPDIALMLAEQTTYPSWGYMVENGATTIWELWNGNIAAPDMNSYNHVMMLGDLLVWYYENLAGIKSDPDAPAFKHIIMKPEFTIDLNEIDASYKSMHGLIKSHWKKNGSELTWNINIPANTTATLHFPVGERSKIIENDGYLTDAGGIRQITESPDEIQALIGSGEYSFRVDLNE